MRNKIMEMNDNELRKVNGGMKIIVIKASQKPSNMSVENQGTPTESPRSDWKTNTPGWNQWF